VIAARIGGTLTSAYPNGSPAAAEGPIKGLPAVPLAANDHLTTSRQPANIILVADTDLLGDLLWVRSRDFFGQRFATAWASNGDFVANSLDNLTGSADLISIRSRANYSRPFTRVDDIKRQAEEHFRAKEQELQHQLTDAEQKLSELQSRRNDQSSLILTPEQEKEVANFQVERHAHPQGTARSAARACTEHRNPRQLAEGDQYPSHAAARGRLRLRGALRAQPAADRGNREQDDVTSGASTSWSVLRSP